MMTDLYRFDGIEKRSTAFRREFAAMSERLRIDPNYLCAVIQTESGFDPYVSNVWAISHGRTVDQAAFGLIQAMPFVLRSYGLTATKLLGMSDIDQLHLVVERFYRPHAGKIKSPGDAYMATFLPAFVGRDPSFVLGVSDNVTIRVDTDGHLVLVGGNERSGHDQLGYGLRLGAVYEQNSGFDRNGDGTITVGEVTATAERNYREAQARGTFDDTLPTGVELPKHMDADDIPWLPLEVSQAEHNANRDHYIRWYDGDDGGPDG
jgi:hypothetical protein